MRILKTIAVSIFLLCLIPASVMSEETGEKIILKIMTINVRHNSDFWEERFPLIADEIVRLAPDIIGLQEVEIGIDQSKVLRALIREKSIAAGKELNYQRYEHLKTGFDMMSGEGVSIYSLHPILDKNFEDLKNGRPALYARVQVNDSLIVDMYNTHMHHQGGDEVRLPQAKILTEFISDHDKGFLTFLTGDMNSHPDSKTIAHLLDSGFMDSFMETPPDARSESEFTSPVIMSKTPVEQNPRNRIDYVFFKSAPGGPPARPVKSEVCFLNHAENGLYPSDHLGVMTTFEITME